MPLGPRMTSVLVSAVLIGLAGSAGTARSAEPKHPYGVIPYGFIAPTPGHIWENLDFVYSHDMKSRKNWGPHGRGYYSSGGCCGLTPPHYNAVSPANFSKPYPALPALSFYRSATVGLPPVPGWDMPEYPPGVKMNGYAGYQGLAPSQTGHHDRRDPPSSHWFAGREREQNFWTRGAFGGR